MERQSKEAKPKLELTFGTSLSLGAISLGRSFRNTLLAPVVPPSSRNQHRPARSAIETTLDLDQSMTLDVPLVPFTILRVLSTLVMVRVP